MPRAPPTPLRAIVSPSILSADFANLARDVNRVADAGEPLAPTRPVSLSAAQLCGMHSRFVALH
jgi:hypothetical protein